jgi:protein-S-isoprenylcysteine O-methyltransferase Ste14
MIAWWKNQRGEWYVIVQVLLFALVLLGPREWAGVGRWGSPAATATLLAGAPLIVAGGALGAVGLLNLGRNLTPLPHPKDDATLVQSGAYAIVRHPIYSGLILGALGWALVVASWLTLAYAVILFMFFDIKSRREERWLAGKFADYAAYQRRVRKLLPWVY